MISDESAGVPSAVVVPSGESGGNGSGEWWSVERAAHTLGVTKRAVRRWASDGSVVARKDPHTLAWEVRADTLPRPREARALRPRPRSAPPESPAVSELVRLLQSATSEACTLAARCGWLEGENSRLRETEQKLLPAASETAEKYRDQVETFRRRDARLTVELVALALVGIAAALL